MKSMMEESQEKELWELLQRIIPKPIVDAIRKALESPDKANMDGEEKFACLLDLLRNYVKTGGLNHEDH